MSLAPKNPERWPTEAEERWLARRLGLQLWFNVGLSRLESRRERIREHVLEQGLADQRAGSRGGQPETFGHLFERLYGVPLEPSHLSPPQPTEEEVSHADDH